MVASPCPLPDFTGFVIKEAQLLLGESLGSGAFGRVHEATFVGSDFHKHYSRSPIAVKCLMRPPPSQGLERDSLQARELALHQKVSDHNNVVTIHQIVVDKSHFYVVMDRCEGDLFEAIVDRKLFRENDDLVRSVFLQLLDAVEFCHQKGVFHRDLKPRNILFSGYKTRKLEEMKTIEVRLADFGLATTNRASNTIGCGTSRYMSPESFGKEFRATAAYSTLHSDIWSLGVILFNMITAHNPWNTPSIVDEHFSSFLVDPNYLLRKYHISVETNNILLRIFDIDPASRISLSKLKNEVRSARTFFRRDGVTRDTSLSVFPSPVPASSLQTISSFDHHSRIRHIVPSPMPTPQSQALETSYFLLQSPRPRPFLSVQTLPQANMFPPPPFLLQGGGVFSPSVPAETCRHPSETSPPVSPLSPSNYAGNTPNPKWTHTPNRPLPQPPQQRRGKVNMHIVLPPPSFPSRRNFKTGGALASASPSEPLVFSPRTIPPTISEEYPFPFTRPLATVIKKQDRHDTELKSEAEDISVVSEFGGPSLKGHRPTCTHTIVHTHAAATVHAHRYTRNATSTGAHAHTTGYDHANASGYEYGYPSSLSAVSVDEAISPPASLGPNTPEAHVVPVSYIPFPPDHQNYTYAVSGKGKSYNNPNSVSPMVELSRDQCHSESGSGSGSGSGSPPSEIFQSGTGTSSLHRRLASSGSSAVDVKRSLRRKNRISLDTHERLVLKEELGIVDIVPAPGGFGVGASVPRPSSLERSRTASLGLLGKKIWKGTKRVFSG
ncbi:hypothetical protein D9758_011712 [Tetrapyrgos nigripes]|uniref:non-specific serine/threonine protein kinase n=1 Tax=Tetrapyrgos nigripes TaxID=182062 RepID=A0A8H5GD45_9AGAR|nr:hypothetical protein D9758_011712 [Tetrapyrgos nigripes]